MMAYSEGTISRPPPRNTPLGTLDADEPLAAGFETMDGRRHPNFTAHRPAAWEHRARRASTRWVGSVEPRADRLGEHSRRRWTTPEPQTPDWCLPEAPPAAGSTPVVAETACPCRRRAPLPLRTLRTT